MLTTKGIDFWNWFSQENRAYLYLNTVDPEVKQVLLDQILSKLHEYCSFLYFEVGSESEDAGELIISANGDRDYFNVVDDLVAGAPSIDKWTITAFISPRDGHFTMNYEDVTLTPDEMWFLPLENKEFPGLIGIQVCLKHYELVKDSEFLEAAVWKVLDTILGERSSAEDIEFVSIDQLPDEPEEEGMIELAELPSYVSTMKSKGF